MIHLNRFSSLSALGFFALSAAAQPTFKPFHANGIYRTGEFAGWSVSGNTQPGIVWRYAVRANNNALVQTGILDFTNDELSIHYHSEVPTMLYVEVTATGPAVPTPPPAPIHLGAAIAPAKFQPSIPRPKDFDSFWAEKLKALSEIPVKPEITPLPAIKPGVDFFTVKLDSVSSHVQGYLARPAKEGKFPALVLYQSAGVKALDTKNLNDRAAEGWLVFSVDSHDMPPAEATGVSTSYATIGYTSRETSYFLNMYLRDARAIDYIRSRPDWDGHTIVLMGTSMGGQQSLVTAALRPEVTAVLINEPAGADLNGAEAGRKPGYPYWPSDNPEVMATAPYFDPVNFASRIKAPVLAAIGFIDTTSPPAGIWTLLNQIPGPKEAICMIDSDHNNRTPEKQGAWTARSKQVLDILLQKGEFTPDQTLPGAGN